MTRWHLEPWSMREAVACIAERIKWVDPWICAYSCTPLSCSSLTCFSSLVVLHTRLPTNTRKEVASDDEEEEAGSSGRGLFQAGMTAAGAAGGALLGGPVGAAVASTAVKLLLTSDSTKPKRKGTSSSSSANKKQKSVSAARAKSTSKKNKTNEVTFQEDQKVAASTSKTLGKENKVVVSNGTSTTVEVQAHLELTTDGHYHVVDREGNNVLMFAFSHDDSIGYHIDQDGKYGKKLSKREVAWFAETYGDIMGAINEFRSKEYPKRERSIEKFHAEVKKKNLALSDGDPIGLKVGSFGRLITYIDCT